jgi:Ca-activated chloride channel homolog
MSIKTSEIARRLAAREDVEPPEGLLDKIKAEIPPALHAVPDLAPEAKQGPSSLPPRRIWLLAASLAVAVFGGVLALRVMQVRPLPSPSLEEEKPAPSELPAVPVPPPARRLELPASPASAGAPKLKQEALPADRDERKDESGKSLRSPGDLAAPVQPAEAPRSMPALPAPPPAEPGLMLRRQAKASKVDAVESGVEGGVAGGVPGGIVGGVPGGIPSTAPEPPLHVGGNETRWGGKGRLIQSFESGRAAAPSTGGTAEPNDQPYGDVFFKSAGVNPFVDTDDDHLSTFGLDVDTGSYTVARRYLSDGHLPPAEAVRVEEFVNYFSYGDEPPSRGDFSLHAEGAPTPFAAGPAYRVLRFNVRAREVSAANRKPAVLTFVVDVSGSMNQENRLELVKQALGLLLGQLRPSDRVGLVIYGSTGQVLLEPTSDHEAIKQAIARLAPGGSTNAEEGLTLGYDVAGRFFRAGAINRIILCTDGVANVGRTGPDSILERIGREARRGIELTALGFGMGNYNDALLEQLADKGDGRYAYIDDLKEARRVFVEELTGTLQTIARDAKAQVDFNPAVVSRWRLLGYENRDIADEKFRDDTVDAGEIGAGHSVTVLYEVKLKPEAPGRIATLHLRFRAADTGEIRETTRDLRTGDLAPSWERATPGLRLASVVAELAEVLRGSYWAKNVDLGDLLQRARQVSAELAETPRASGVSDIAGFVRMVADVSRLKREEAGRREE